MKTENTECYYVVMIDFLYLKVGVSFQDKWVRDVQNATQWKDSNTPCEYINKERIQLLDSHSLLVEDSDIGKIKVCKVLVFTKTEITEV
jgi:hypothetical protein